MWRLLGSPSHAVVYNRPSTPSAYNNHPPTLCPAWNHSRSKPSLSFLCLTHMGGACVPWMGVSLPYFLARLLPSGGRITKHTHPQPQQQPLPHCPVLFLQYLTILIGDSPQRTYKQNTTPIPSAEREGHLERFIFH